MITSGIGLNASFVGDWVGERTWDRPTRSTSPPGGRTGQSHRYVA
jgi:hypothetical protein